MTWIMWDENYTLYCTQKEGILTNAVVSRLPYLCLSKHNTIGINIAQQQFLLKKLAKESPGGQYVVGDTIQQREFSLKISARDCYRGKYVVGDTIQVIYHRALNKVLQPTANMTFMLWLSFAPLLFPFWVFYKLKKNARQIVAEWIALSILLTHFFTTAYYLPYANPYSNLRHRPRHLRGLQHQPGTTAASNRRRTQANFDRPIPASWRANIFFISGK